jgi:hypothetical protein
VQSQYEEVPVGRLSPPVGGESKDKGPSEFAGGEPPSLCPCSVCGRKFMASRLPQHEAACVKASQKRQAFNAQKQRMTEEQSKMAKTESLLESKLATVGAPARSSSTSYCKGDKQVPKWKRQSQAFQQMLQQTRRDKKLLQSGVKMSDLPPPPQTDVIMDDRVGCPHCGRSFNQQAAERHIPQCSDIKAKPKRLARGGGTGGGKRRT